MIPKICREVRELGPDAAPMARRVADSHLEQCTDCREALASPLASGLQDPDVPEGLLEDVLSASELTGVRGKLVGPARGAVSGAKPQLTAAVIVTGALAGTGVAWGTVRGVRKIRKRRRPIS